MNEHIILPNPSDTSIKRQQEKKYLETLRWVIFKSIIAVAK